MYGGSRGYSSRSSRLTGDSCTESAATSELLVLSFQRLWLEHSSIPHIPFLTVAMQPDWSFARRLVSVESHASTDSRVESSSPATSVSLKMSNLFWFASLLKFMKSPSVILEGTGLNVFFAFEKPSMNSSSQVTQPK